MDFIAKRNKLRRRKLLVLINAVCTATIHWKRKAYFKQLNSLSKKIDRDGNIYRDRENMLREINAFPDYIFRSMFRVDRSTFEEILSKITPNLASNSDIDPLSKEMAARSVKGGQGSALSPRIKLLATLRFLAGGMKWDICFAFKIGWGSFFSTESRGVFWPVCEAIDLSYTIGLDFNPAVLQKHSEEFAAICPASAPVFDGVVLALDGWVMETRCPYRKEVDNVMSYRNRKGMWGIVILAGCDARCKFHMWNNKNTGSTNDCTAWDNSALKERIEDGALPGNYYFIGDEAFVLQNNFLIPWGGTGIGSAKDSFNYHLSARRQVIERAFGILVKRWGIFARPLLVKHSRWALVSTVCAKLHNICIDKNVPTVMRRILIKKSVPILAATGSGLL